jgi:hypothetical protein
MSKPRNVDAVMFKEGQETTNSEHYPGLPR